MLLLDILNWSTSCNIFRKFLIRMLPIKGGTVSNSLKFIIIMLFAASLFYVVTYSSLLQRMAYDVYECKNQEQGDIKLLFEELAIGQRFEFTRNGVISNLEILDIRDSKVIFEDRQVALELDISTNRLLQDDQSITTFFSCNLNQFTM